MVPNLETHPRDPKIKLRGYQRDTKDKHVYNCHTKLFTFLALTVAFFL